MKPVLKNQFSPEFQHFSKFFGVKVKEKFVKSYILGGKNPVGTIPYLVETSGKTLGWLCLIFFALMLAIFCVFENFCVGFRCSNFVSCRACVYENQDPRIGKWTLTFGSIIIGILVVVYSALSTLNTVPSYGERWGCSVRFGVEFLTEGWDSKEIISDSREKDKQGLKGVNWTGTSYMIE